MLKIKDEETILKHLEKNDKKKIYHNTDDFSTYDIKARRHWNDIFKVLNK